VVSAAKVAQHTALALRDAERADSIEREARRIDRAVAGADRAVDEFVVEVGSAG
jgi:hypothetical protein